MLNYINLVKTDYVKFEEYICMDINIWLDKNLRISISYERNCQTIAKRCRYSLGLCRHSV